jgi:hypothetical protein
LKGKDIMKRRLNIVLTLPLICGAIIVCVCLSSARSQKNVPASTGLPLIPIFSPEQDSPLFVGTFHNDGDQRVNEIKLYSDSSIVLDGKTFAHESGEAFFGRPGVGAHNKIWVCST